MFKKLISLTLSVMMVMALIAVPAMAAGEETAVFSSDNVKRNYYNLANGMGSNSTISIETTAEADEVAVPAAEHVGQGAGSRQWKVKSTWLQTKNESEYQTVKYSRTNSTAGHNNNGTAPRYVHQRVKFVWYDNTKSSNNRLRFALSSDSNGARAKLFQVSGKDHSDVYFERWDQTSETNARLVWNSGTPIKVSGSGEKIVNTMDIIVNVNDNESNHKGMVYVFFNGELYVYGKSTTSVPAFYGWSITQYGGDSGEYLEMWQDEDRIGHTEYYDANGYVPTFEDVLNDAGLTDAIPEDSNIMMKTSDMRWFMPHGNDKVRIDAATKASSATNWLNNDGTMNTVVYNGTQATVSRTPSDSGSWEKAANLLAGVYPQTAHGIGYSSYHPRFKYVRFSFDQTIGNGTQLAYWINDSEASAALKLSDNNGQLKVDLCGVSKTSDAPTFQKNRIDWVIEPNEGTDAGSTSDDTLTHYLFVNEKLVATATSEPGVQKVRIDDIGLYTKGSNPSVVYDNWSMTLYNTNQTYEALYEEITGEGLSVEPTFAWSEDCAVEYLDGIVAPIVSATAKNFDGQAKVYFAAYAADNTLLDCTVYDFESGVVYGDEGYVEFDESNYAKPVEKISVFIFETGTIRPLIVNKTILKSEFVTE